MDKRAQTESLWKKCFGDDDEYIRLYFDAKYCDKNTYCLYRQSQMISVLQAIPYEIRFHGLLISGRYISGACTDPDFREKGLMRQLLSSAITDIFHCGADVAFLIPAQPKLYNYYEQNGFGTQFMHNIEKYHIEQHISGTVQTPSLAEAQLTGIFELYQNHTLTRNGVIHHAQDFSDVLAEHYLSGGKMLLLGTINSPKAFALAITDKDKVRISELISTTEEDKMRLIQQSAQIFNRQDVEVVVPGSNSRCGMIRIVNVLNILQKLASARPDIQQVIHIFDPVITENTGTYNISNGQCSQISHSMPQNYWNLDQLADFIFQKSLFINLMFE